MRVNNYTKYDTATLRKITQMCLTEFKKRERTNKNVSKSYTVTFKTHRGQGWVGGYAYYHSSQFCIKLPLTYNRKKFTFVQSIADVIFHELGHCIGVKHRLNRGNKWDTIEAEYEDWIRWTFTADWELLPEQKEKKQVDMQMVRFLRAKKNAEKATTRYKRAKTILTKWNSKVKYYEKALAKAGKLPTN